MNKIFENIKKIDESILKAYTKLSKNTKEGKLYTITTFLNLGSIEGVSFFWYHLGLNLITSGMIGASISAIDTLYNLELLSGERDTYSREGTIIKNPLLEYKKKYNRTVRLPLFVTGAALTGIGIYDIIKPYITKQPFQADDIDNLWTGLSYLGLASSMYLKDRNPKLLQKQSLLDRIYSLIKQTTKSYLPKTPKPVPQPQTYRNLEDIV